MAGSQGVEMTLIGSVQVLARANIRQGAPSRTSPILRKAPAGARLAVRAIVVGEAVGGNAHWFGLADNGYIWSGACGPLGESGGAPAPGIPAPPATGLGGFGLDPAFESRLSALLQACAEAGLNFKVSQGLRTPQVQADYYCQWTGRPPAEIDAKVAQLRQAGAPWIAELLAARRDMPRKPGWLTNAAPGAGWHQWGEAADCYCYRDGVIVENGADPCYRTYADLALKLGLTPGLDFTTHPDAGHVQLRPQGGATALYSWREIDATMQARFGDKPALQ